MTSGSSWSESFVRQLASDKELRDEFVADQVRSRIGLMVRAMREQEPRHWTQKELGEAMDKPQSVVSRVENPDYGKHSLQTLLEIASAFDVPLIVDFPEWEDWFRRIKAVRKADLERRPFNAENLIAQTKPIETAGNVSSIFDAMPISVTGTNADAFKVAL